MSCADNVISLKKGDSFSKSCKYVDEDGVGIDLTNYDISSEVRDTRGNLIATLTITKYNQTTDAGTFLVSAEDGTDDWPLARIEWDIRYVLDSIVTHTDAVVLNVVRSVTSG